MSRQTMEVIMRTKRLFIALIIIVMIITTLTGCSQKASRYTEEQHMQRISERIQKKYIDGDIKVRDFRVPKDADDAFIKLTGFEVYPLYDNNDELKYCLVELQPFGFIYILIQDEQPKILSRLGASTSMYRTAGVMQPAWTPCHIDKETGETIWEEESGVMTEYYRSPFAERGVLAEKKYIIRCEEKDVAIQRLIPAVKRDGKYINLYSNEEFDVVDGRATEKLAFSQGISFIVKHEFDL